MTTATYRTPGHKVKDTEFMSTVVSIVYLKDFVMLSLFICRRSVIVAPFISNIAGFLSTIIV